MSPPPRLPPLPVRRDRTIARLLIAFAIAVLVGIPALFSGVRDALLVFALSFLVTLAVLRLVTNP